MEWNHRVSILDQLKNLERGVEAIKESQAEILSILRGPAPLIYRHPETPVAAHPTTVEITPFRPCPPSPTTATRPNHVVAARGAFQDARYIPRVNTVHSTRDVDGGTTPRFPPLPALPKSVAALVRVYEALKLAE